MTREAKKGEKDRHVLVWATPQAALHHKITHSECETLRRYQMTILLPPVPTRQVNLFASIH